MALKTPNPPGPNTSAGLIPYLRILRRLVGLLCLLGAQTLAALDPARDLFQFDLRTWSLAEGLPGNRVQAVLQTRDGCLWVGTIEGLARFDGARFLPQELPVARKGTRLGVFHLAEDGAGGLWIATHEGVLCLRDGGFTRLTTREGLPSNLVSHLLPDPDGSLWIGTSEGVCRVREGRVQSFGLADGLSGLNVQALARGADGQIWVGTRQGLDRWTGARFMPHRPAGLQGTAITALCADRDGALWVGTDKGLARLVGDRVEEVPGGDRFRDAVTLLHQDREGSLWAACKNAGVYRLVGGRIEPLLHRGKPVFFCVAMAEDHEGSLWLGTLDYGMHQLAARRVKVLDDRRGLPASIVRNVLEDRRGTLWMGTVGEGLVALEGGRYRTFGRAEGLRNLSVWCLLEESDGSLLVGTYGGGLHRLRGGRILPVGADQGLGREIVRGLLRDRRGRLWVGTEGGGLHLLQGDRLVRTWTRRNGLADDQVYALAEDRDGAIWVGCFNGALQRFTESGIRTYGPGEGLPSATIFALHPRLDGSLWVASARNGILRLKDGRFSQLTTQHGLPGNTCFRMIETPEGRMWVVSSDGTADFGMAALDAAAEGGPSASPGHLFARDEGVGSPPGPSSPCGWLARDGRLWLPISQGVAVLETQPRGPQPRVPPMAVLRLVVDGREWLRPSSVEVQPGRGDAEVDFTAYSFQEPGKVRFRYRLEGYQQDWVEVGTRRTAYFTGLPPGRYLFRVVACNSDGLWNMEGAALAFRIRTPWHRTPWALAGFALAGAGTLGAMIGWRLRLVQRQKEDLERKVAERTLELAAANEALQRQSLTDPLTGLGNRRSIDEAMGTLMRRFLRRQADPEARNRDLAFLLLDLDHFKTVNDTYGHAAGDGVLRQVAQVLRKEVRDTDRLVRWGGEEFVVVALDTDRSEVPALAERIRQAVATSPFPAGGPQSCSLSIGFSVLPLRREDPEWPGWEHALSLADECLYLAKAEGRNRWVGAMPVVREYEGTDLPAPGLDLLVEQGWITLVRGPLA